MSPSRTKRQYLRVTLRVASVHAYCTHMRAVVEPYPVNFLFTNLSCCYFTLCKNLLPKLDIFRESVTVCQSLCDATVSGASADPTSQCRSSAIFVLPHAGN